MASSKLSLGILGGVTAYSIHPMEQIHLRDRLRKQLLENEIRENNDVILAAANGLRILAAKDSVLVALRDGVPTLIGKSSLDVPLFTYTTTSLLRDGKDVLEGGMTVAWHANSDGRNMTLRDLPPAACLGLPEHRKNFPLRLVLQGDMGRATLSLAALFIGHRVSLQVRSRRTVESRPELGYSVGERYVALRFWPVGLPEIYQIFLKEARDRWGVPDFQLNHAYPARDLETLRLPVPAPASRAARDPLLEALGLLPAPPAAAAPAAPAARPSVCGCVADGPCYYCSPLEDAWGGEAAAEAPSEIRCACTDESQCEPCEARWTAEMDAEAEARGDYDWEEGGYEAEVNHGADLEY